ncbi:hypothetical protein ACUY4R_004161 [Kosakonia sp. BK9b]
MVPSAQVIMPQLCSFTQRKNENNVSFHMPLVQSALRASLPCPLYICIPAFLLIYF